MSVKKLSPILSHRMIVMIWWFFTKKYFLERRGGSQRVRQFKKINKWTCILLL